MCYRPLLSLNYIADVYNIYDTTAFLMKGESEMRLSAFFSALILVLICNAGSILANNAPTDIILTPGLPSPVTGPLETKVTAPDSSANDRFGFSTSISGDYAIVGAYGDDENGTDAGAAYIYTRVGDTWSQTVKLTASDIAAGDKFGYSVSVSGDYVVIGASTHDHAGVDSGAVYVFEREGEVWIEQVKLIGLEVVAGDSFGRHVSIHGEYVAIGALGAPYTAGAVYVFKRDGSSWTEQARLVTSSGSIHDQFPYSVCITDEYVFAGASWNAGIVYVYERTGTTWNLVDILRPSDGQNADKFGRSISVYGNNLVIGSGDTDDNGHDSGSVYIFKWDGDNWVEEAKLLNSDGSPSDHFGFSSMICGDYLLAGAIGDDDNGGGSGSAYVFRWDSTAWNEEIKIAASDGAASDSFSYSCSVSGNHVIIGAPFDDDNADDSGSAYFYDLRNLHPLMAVNVYENSLPGTLAATIDGDDLEGDPLTFSLQKDPSGNFEIIEEGSTWRLQVASGARLDYEDKYSYPITIRAEDDNGGVYDEDFTITVLNVNEPPIGLSLVNVANTNVTASDRTPWDSFGSSVSMFGDSIIVGAQSDDDNGPDSGSAYIFRRDGLRLIDETKLIAGDGEAKDEFGLSVSISSDYTVVGARSDSDNGYSSGSAYVYKRDGSAWTEQAKLTASDGAAWDNFGRSVSISGDYIVVGADGDGDNGSGSGSAYVFERNGNTWNEQAKLLASDGAQADNFGCSVSISGEYIIVGASHDDDKGPRSGSAYIFKKNGATWAEQAKLVASDGGRSDWFGWSVSISEDCAIVGAVFEDSAYIFRRDSTAWIEESKLIASDRVNLTYFGQSVSISGDCAIVGVAYGSLNEESPVLAYIFQRNESVWVEAAKLTASGVNTDESSGGDVAISGHYAAAVHTYYSDDGRDSESAYIYNLRPEAQENSPAEMLVGIINGFDQDGDTLTYSLYSDPSNNFEVVNDNGTWKLQVATGATLDHDAAQSHDITIRADDGFDGVYDQDFTIYVLDVNGDEGCPDIH